MNSGQLKQFKKLIREREEGFSLIELVVVVSVLSVLSAIAIPTFNCSRKKGQATAALAAMKQIQIECEINKINNSSSNTFNTSIIHSYQIQSDGSNSCDGASATGLIQAIPSDTEILPTFILAANTNELTYDFKGIKGSSITECLPLICGTSTLVHDPYLDPIHGSQCTQFRTSMVRGGKLETGCYGDNWDWLPDPCALTRQGCNSTSFYTSHGWYPCIAGEDKFKFKVPDGFPETTSRNCASFNPDPPPRNCYCWPPRDNCTCD